MKFTDIAATLALFGTVTLGVLHLTQKPAPTLPTYPPADLVATFDSTMCPAGWAEFSNADGRFLVGAGQFEDTEFVFSTNGGSTNHNHSGRTSAVGAHSGEDDTKHKRSSAHDHTFTTSTNGHLPPYTVVTFCKKLKVQQQ